MPANRVQTNNSLFALLIWATITALILTSCQPAPQTGEQAHKLKVVAVESFLAEIAQNVAGDRAEVEALIAAGVDPHAFEPSPRDVARIAESDLLIANGGGFEAWLGKTLEAAGGNHVTVEASQGLSSRTPAEAEKTSHTDEEEGKHAEDGEGDPHFWLNPLNVVRYVENIRDGLIKIDPEGKDAYTKNAESYIAQLKELDQWIGGQITVIPTQRRLMITNHESFGYFADRYGLKIIGTVIPSVSSSASPSAQQLAHLVDIIRETQAPAIFLETGANSQLANQLSQETGIKVVTGLYTHSVTANGGEAPTYIEMMRVNTRMIVDALK